VGLRKVFLLEHALPQNWTKSKRQEWPFQLLPLSSKATKSGSKFSFGLFVFNGKFGGDSPVVFKLYFQWQQGGFIVKKMVGNFSFFGYSSWKQKRGGGGGMLMVRSNPQLTIGNGL
jgi:hypothetical protein